MDILGICASPRKAGNTDVLLDEVMEGAKSNGATAEIAHLRDYSIESCVGCERCRQDKTCTRFHDGMNLLYPKIEEAKGLVLGSPTYNYNVTSLMKTFIDRLYPYYNFTDDRPREYSSRLAGQGRRACVFTIGEQPIIEDIGFSLEAMSYPLEALGYTVDKAMPVLNQFDRGIIKKDEAALKNAFEMGEELAGKLK
ncbi:flavodoxin family protein [Methanohalophilus portucalensis FDF-1]|uniref:Flavodoxin family protein n=2 Tax=Methanohalophilus portucalensis TaxID=39664 RepID=A0A3M9LE54_9EURY|nr:flavodoxin family protein [Methanohalophilus portucalensis]ATU08887.1 flavodoxin [Methanohalophilus portucalensis]RNI11267.1 flavodoxin family protein [Methanohalophilus portucalensis FDF-1]